MTKSPTNLTGGELKVLLEAGFVLREASRFDDAEKVFSGCAALMPASEVPLVALGTVYLQKGDYQRALETCQSAVRRSEDSPYARLHLGEALMFIKRTDEARLELKRVIETAPGTTYAKTALNILNATETV